MNSPAAPYINCPHCSTIFAAPALLPEHGKVRCGVCNGVLEAKLHELHELPDEPIDAELAPVDEATREPAATAEPVEAIDDGFDLDDLAPAEDEGFTEQTVNLDSESGAGLDDVFAIEASEATEADGADEEAIDLSLPFSEADSGEVSGDIDLADLAGDPHENDEINDRAGSDLTGEPDGAVDLASLMADEGIEFASSPIDELDDADETWFDPSAEDQSDLGVDDEIPAAGDLAGSGDTATENLDQDSDGEVVDELDTDSVPGVDEADVAEEPSQVSLPTRVDELESQEAADSDLFAPGISDHVQPLTETAEAVTPQDESQPGMDAEDDAVETADGDDDGAENLEPLPVPGELVDDALPGAEEQNEEESPAERAEEDQQADRLFAEAGDAPLDESFDNDVESVGGEESDSPASVDEIFEIDEVAEVEELSSGDDDEEARHRDDSGEPVVAEQLEFGDAEIVDTAEVPAESAALIEPEEPALSEDDLKPVRVSRWWLVAHLGMALLLVVVIAAQILYLTREPLQDDERFRPWQESLCNLVGCELPVRRDVSKLGAVAKVVISHPRYLDALRIDLSLQNRAAFAQPFPTIRVLFLDKRDRELAGRDFAPEEYLRGPLAGKTLLQPMVPEQIVLEIKDPGPRAVNYRFSYL
ncbi:MAG: DUF3426 domain-containing protein [Immundisolibacteraceae bacterium]|nr:DUF3426 domain-containing protein [Immundisolibacteraceae bacterium]